MEKSDLYKRYEKVCNEYLKKFCDKHDFYYEPEYWIGGEVGGIIELADYFVSLSDMIIDIEMNAPEEEFIKWYDYSMDCHYAELPCMNYKNWLQGCPRHDPEELKRKSKEGQDKLFKDINTQDIQFYEDTPEPKALKDEFIGHIDEYLNKFYDKIKKSGR